MYLTLTLRKPGWRTDQTSPDKTYLMLYIYIYIYMYIYIYIETVFKTKNGVENLHSKRMPKGQVGRRKGAKDSAACMGCNVGKGVFRVAPAPD